MKNKTGLKGLENFENHDAVYLVEIQNETVLQSDGCHSEIDEVEKAFFLWKRLGCVSVDNIYKLLRVKDQIITLEDFNKEAKPRGINEEALSLCEKMVSDYQENK